MNPLITKKDYFLVAIIGFFFGLLLLPILNNLKIAFLPINLSSGLLLVVGWIIFAVFALWIASLLAHLLPILLQFAKFGAVGALNTLFDLGILNTLIFFSGVASGYWYSIFKATSFIIASTNSYLWNKYWTFGVSGSTNIKEFSQFFLVTLIGFGINVGLASLIVNVVGPIGNIAPAIWANVGAFAATIAAFAWNFLGYKFIVFKR